VLLSWCGLHGNAQTLFSCRTTELLPLRVIAALALGSPVAPLRVWPLALQHSLQTALSMRRRLLAEANAGYIRCVRKKKRAELWRGVCVRAPRVPISADP
jgi:hypothetical protein